MKVFSGPVKQISRPYATEQYRRIFWRAWKDPLCKAWKLKLSGKDNVDPTTLVPEPAIAPQKASDIISLRADEILKSVKGELKGKTPVQVKELKITIANICRSQALAHRHAADAANHLVMLTDIASMPVVLMVINAVQ